MLEVKGGIPAVSPKSVPLCHCGCQWDQAWNADFWGFYYGGCGCGCFSGLEHTLDWTVFQ